MSSSKSGDEDIPSTSQESAADRKRRKNREKKQRQRNKNPEKAKEDRRSSMAKVRDKNPDKAKGDRRASMSKVREKNSDKAKEDTRASMAKTRASMRPDLLEVDIQRFQAAIRVKPDKKCKSCHSSLWPHQRKEFMGEIYCSFCYKTVSIGREEMAKLVPPHLWKTKVDHESRGSPGPCSERHDEKQRCSYCFDNPKRQKKIDSTISDLQRYLFPCRNELIEQ